MRICVSATTLPSTSATPHEAPQVSAPLHELDAQRQLIAGPHRLLEARLLDADEVENPNPLFGGRRFVGEHAAGLRQRFDDQHAGHDGMARESAPGSTPRWR